jgi:hypothetical protein
MRQRTRYTEVSYKSTRSIALLVQYDYSHRSQGKNCRPPVGGFDLPFFVPRNGL